VLADDASTDEHLTAMSPQRMVTPSVDHDTHQPTTTTATTTSTTADNTVIDVTADIAVSLVYHLSDFTVTPISDVSKVMALSLI